MASNDNELRSFHTQYHLMIADDGSADGIEASLNEVIQRHQHPGIEMEREEKDEATGTEEVGALSTQIGGGHYKEMKIQPVEFSQLNGLGFCEGNMVKYAVRHREKNGIEDLKKVKHYAELCAWLEYGETI